MRILNEDVRKLFFEEDDSAGKQKENVPDENGILIYTGGNVEDRYKGKVKKVIVKDGVTSIEKMAFWDCGNLERVTIPPSVTSIGGWAFEDCSSLTSIEIPSGVTRIRESAFAWCRSLTSITIPSSVVGIGDWAFYGCNNLTIRCKQGSRADKYAQNNYIPVKYI